LFFFKSKIIFYPIRRTRPILSSNSISTPRFNGSPILNKSSSNIFNTSNARIPKTVAVVKRLAVRNGSIGAIKPMKQKKRHVINYQKKKFFLPGRASHRSKHRFSRLIDQEKTAIKANATGKKIKFPVR
jgi:hypothetical protein